MRPVGTAAALEERRKDAIKMWKTGRFTELEVAERFGVHKRTVEKWVHNYNQGGMKALNAIPNVIPECPLSPAQRHELEVELLKGSQALGFCDGLWTCARVALLIERKFGVHYHRDSIARVLHRELGWSVQRPQFCAKERDERAVGRWLKTTWAETKKKPRGKGPPSSSPTRAQ